MGGAMWAITSARWDVLREHSRDQGINEFFFYPQTHFYYTISVYIEVQMLQANNYFFTF